MSTDDGYKEKARLAHKAKPLLVRIAALRTTSSDLSNSLLFYLTPLLCLLPDYLTPTFPLSNTLPDSCPGTVDASYTMKLKQQKLYIPFYHTYYPSVKKIFPKLTFFCLSFYFLKMILI
jgi:hypothetical protein